MALTWQYTHGLCTNYWCKRFLRSCSCSSSSNDFICNRLQHYNTVCVINITNSRVIIDIVVWFLWWPPEKPWAYQAGRHKKNRISIKHDPWVSVWYFNKPRDNPREFRICNMCIHISYNCTDLDENVNSLKLGDAHIHRSSLLEVKVFWHLYGN